MELKLDKFDKRIIYELDKHARIPDTKLAKKIGKSKEAVRYRIQRLENAGIIKGYTIWVDYTKLGYGTGKLYLNLANIPEKKSEFIKYVNSDRRLFWFGVAEGAWNAGITYFVRSVKEFYELKNDLFSKFEDLIIESHTAMVVDISVCNRTFLYDEENIWTQFFDMRSSFTLATEDTLLLKHLIYNGRENLASIARKTGISIDIIRSRKKSLEDKGIIIRYIASVDYSKLGYEFFKTFLYFSSLSEEEETRLKEHCLRNKYIVHFIRQISPWDVELEIMCENYHEYLGCISELTREFSHSIKKVETAIMGEDYVFPKKELIFEE